MPDDEIPVILAVTSRIYGAAGREALLTLSHSVITAGTIDVSAKAVLQFLLKVGGRLDTGVATAPPAWPPPWPPPWLPASAGPANTVTSKLVDGGCRAAPGIK